ncbi:hypothetical protein [Aureibacter tunicatorum]|uniref:Uncharacterized protein n=1 Tax=Aureibacter tunicatorum TaxID=866807 RepID=A0AAE3XQ87_9BACT|nr:hypothetical protein [Aureibacter tunicatorum]MDR6240060.1 hypothetical protein [Aureibacter tunicatorum]BDD04532.1 hypothetical protein AUTU_20150 [Aureibacter tunicatorum]
MSMVIYLGCLRSIVKNITILVFLMLVCCSLLSCQLENEEYVESETVYPLFDEILIEKGSSSTRKRQLIKSIISDEYYPMTLDYCDPLMDSLSKSVRDFFFQSKTQEISLFSNPYKKMYDSLKVQIDSILVSEGINHENFFNEDELKSNFFAKKRIRENYYRAYNLTNAIDAYYSFKLENIIEIEKELTLHSHNFSYYPNFDSVRVGDEFELIIKYYNYNNLDRLADFSHLNTEVIVNDNLVDISTETFGSSLLIKFTPLDTGKHFIKGDFQLSFEIIPDSIFDQSFSTYINVYTKNN